jgi:hypothetical protein
VSTPAADAARRDWVSGEAPSSRRRARDRMTPLAIGIGVGLISIGLGAFELRWIVLVFAVIIGWLVITLVRDRERLLTTLFLLSMQMDIYVRFLHGRASTAGFEFPLSVCVGMLLWAQMRVTEDTRGSFVWFGELFKPIRAALVTTFVALLFTNERFAGAGRLLFELQLVFVYALAMNIVRRENDARKLTSIMLLTLGVQSVICIIQWRLGMSFSLLGDTDDLGDIPRPGGTVSTNPAGFCSFIMPALMVAAARFMNRDRREQHPFDWLLVLLGVTAIILTFTRAAWVGLALGLGYITVIGVRRRYITARKLVIVAVAVVAIAIPAIPLMQARLNLAPVGDSYDERANLNWIAVNVIIHHPLFGLGPGAYDQEFKQYLPPGADRFWLAGVHNEYLMRTAETGLPGGIAFVWLLLSALAQARRLSHSTDTRTRIFALGWSAGLLALAWQMYWVPWRGFSYNSILWLFMGATEALTIIDERRKASYAENPT